MMSQPRSTRPCAKGTMPRLSLTEINARGTMAPSRIRLHGLRYWDRAAGIRGGPDYSRQQSMFCFEHPGGERLRRIARENRNPALGQDRSAIVFLIHQVDGTAGNLGPARQY